MNPPPLAFSDWMQRALYDPDDGYYTRHIRSVGGQKADFTTVPTHTPALGNALLQWIIAEATHWNWFTIPVIEIGPGQGTLAAAILRAAGWLRRLRIQFHLVESSPILSSLQRAHLKNQVRWHPSLADAITACEGRALLISNELIDAFPCDIHRLSTGTWEKLHLIPTNNTWTETWLPDTTNPLPFSALRSTDWPAPNGQRIETHDSYRTWLTQQTQQWTQGSLWTCDYGEKFPTIYHRRPHGTIRAYFHHQRLEFQDIYPRMGRQDLTADVNFTDIQAWGESLGLTTVTLQPLTQFLHSYPAPPSWLTDPHGPGAAFQTLWQRR